MYNVSLMVSNAAGNNTILMTDYINVSAPVAPVADFTGTPQSGIAPLTVTFTDASTGTAPLTWAWDFGDGSIENATLQNPVHTYATVGIYSVSLTVSNAVGVTTTTYPNYITVSPTPLAPVTDFSGFPLSGAAPLVVTFYDNSTGTDPLTWAWDFGDGSTENATLQNPVHTYATNGTYNVSLIVSNAVGNNTMTRIGYITVLVNTAETNSIFRPASGYWYFDYNLDGIVDKSFRYGGSGDQIIRGDWQGTGKDGIAIFRPTTGYWYFDYNLDGIIDKSFRYGGSTDKIIVGTWA